MSSIATPRVSVLMITYNHERFIAQAIESVLMQRTDFPIELIIGEDCSTDGTREIVRRYAAKHPTIIRPLLHERNVGMGPNAEASRAACRAALIATLEGDDYWTSPDKLASQVAWLEANPEAPACFHDARVVDETGAEVQPRYCVPKPPARVALENLLERNPIPTCSVVFRRSAIPPLPERVYRLPMQDWPSWVLAARVAPLGFIDEPWSCYRRHASGQWSATSWEKQMRNVVSFYPVMRTVLERRYRTALAAGEKQALANLIELLASQGRWSEARPLARRYLLLPPGRFRAPANRAGLYYRLVSNLPSAQMLESATRSNA